MNERIDPAKKALWVAALRSGLYVQGKDRLTTVTPEGEKDCCLGVVCRLTPGIQRIEKDDLYDSATHLVEWNQEKDILPSDIADRWNLDRNPAIYCPSDSHGEDQFFHGDSRAKLLLAKLNDDGFSFDQIADIIDYFF